MRPFVSFVALVIVGVAARLAFVDVPNFAPVAGLAIYAGFALRSPWLALAVPLAVMGITDLKLGGYEPLLRVVVYTALVFPMVFGCVLGADRARRCSSLVERWSLRTVGWILGGTLAGSLVFFLSTNFATWAVTEWYPRTWAGLLDCYICAIPFFRYTVAGDLVFSALFFGSHFCRDLVVSVHGDRAAIAEQPPIAASRGTSA